MTHGLIDTTDMTIEQLVNGAQDFYAELREAHGLDDLKDPDEHAADFLLRAYLAELSERFPREGVPHA